MFVMSAADKFDNRGENAVRDWLSGWRLDGPHPVHGFALVGFNLGVENGPRQVDALVFTPTACFLLEVKGIFSKTCLGELTIDLNGKWTLGGEPAPLHVPIGCTNPFGQATRAMYDVKKQLGDEWIDWAVVVVTNTLAKARVSAVSRLTFPPASSAVSRSGYNFSYGERFSQNTHRVVLASNAGPMKALLGKRYGQAIVWDAAKVLAAARKLGLTDLPSWTVNGHL